MKVSGFTMVRNADRLYFPMKESIQSVLPLVDEFVIALGEGDDGDDTLAIINEINSEKIIVYPRIWSEESFKESRIFAEETNFALSKCKGEWCIYIQADEVIHEDDYNKIQVGMERHRNNPEIDGLLFNYLHFWGDYNHFLPFHGWYKHEIRIIKNNRGIYSYKDAQSFRKNNNQKLNVAEIDARIFHYGWVRPPSIMQTKKKVHEGFHHGTTTAENMYKDREGHFDYGPLGRVPEYRGSHPEVMKNWINRLDWADQLNFTKNWNPSRPLHKHEQFKYRFLTWMEDFLGNGKSIFGYSNWKIRSQSK